MTVWTHKEVLIKGVSLALLSQFLVSSLLLLCPRTTPKENLKACNTLYYANSLWASLELQGARSTIIIIIITIIIIIIICCTHLHSDIALLSCKHPDRRPFL
ncbi:hypothetical protein EYF80_021678 [Liparis tanakae]|uniref:Uncharacterized protein n=1 Tax=Liparis tanakae TaxID=230148 RepID=A0A4Z2HST5_9TELE|nr:hypothetical protein EYF80_021678 [Liparis tanakae]